MNNTARSMLGVLLVIVMFIGLICFWSAATIIGPGERGVVTHWGKVTGRILDPGFQFIAPISENAWIVDVRVQKEEIDANAASQDLQEVSSKLALNYHIDPNQVSWIYQNLGPEFKSRIIDPSIQESFKAVTAQFPVSELLTKRPEVKEKALQILRDRLHKNNIIVDDLSIVNFNFSASFNNAIEAKQVAQQNAEQAQYKLDAAVKDAQAIKIQGDALKENPDLVQWEAVKKWNGVLPTVTGGSIPLIQIGK